MTAPRLKLHTLVGSHPCRTAQAALELKRLDYEQVVLAPGEHTAVIEDVYGPGRTTVPGLLVGDQPVHGSSAILARLEQLQPEPPLFPAAIADAVREAERWGAGRLQDLGRWFIWGSFHFRPEHMFTFAGAPVGDPEATDLAIRIARAGWRYHDLSAVKIATGLAELPACLDEVDSLAAAGTLGGEAANAADLQIGATLRLMLNIGDLVPLIEGRAAERVARRWFGDYEGWIPAGAFPTSWIPR